MKTIGMVGSRQRNSNEDFQACYDAFEALYKEGDRIISGGCSEGGDHFAEMIARDLGVTIIIHHANWDKYGKAAGPIRNTLIAKDCDVLIAVVSEDRKGGTEDTVKKALKLEKKVIYV